MAPVTTEAPETSEGALLVPRAVRRVDMVGEGAEEGAAEEAREEAALWERREGVGSVGDEKC